MILLQERTKIPTVRIDENVRQQNINLKEVVDLLASGKIEQGYRQLQANGKIKQMPIDSLRNDAVVQDYLKRDEKTQAQTLVLAGTNTEKEAITIQIRRGLIESGKLGENSQQIQILKPKDLNQFSLTQANNSPLGTILLLAGLFLLLWGMNNTQVALMLMENPRLILPYLVDKFGLFKLIFGAGGIVFLLWLILISSNSNNAHVLRGAKVIPHRKLRATLKRQPKLKKQPQLQLAGMPIPAMYENRGFFVVGSPGSGKTQAISQMVAVLKQRTDFRGIVFDRGGEMLGKFYDPKKDLIFNPFDARSCHWTHYHEPARPETMAAGLIPLQSNREPFFSIAGRAILAELFRQTKTNQELLELLQSDIATLSSFLSGTLAARYLGEEKVSTSVLSNVVNYCEFYSSLIQPQNKALSFYNWGASDSQRWIFITLRENDTELLKPLYSLIFELMLKGLLSNEERSRKTAVVIDELGALNHLPSLHRLLSESRKFLGCPILGTQTEAQITKIYGREDTRIILQGTKTKLILNCADPQTAEMMAKIIGKQESVYLASNRSRSHHKGGQNRTLSENEQLRESYAVLPAELQDLPDLKGYFKIAGLPAAAVKVKIKKFPTLSKRFVRSNQVNHSGELETIQQQWGNFKNQNLE